MLKRIFGVLFLSALVLMTSCDKEDDGTGNGNGTDSTGTVDTTGGDTTSIGGDDSTAVATANNLIQETADQLDAEMMDMSEVEGLKAAMDFMELMNEEDGYTTRSMYVNGSATADIMSIMRSNFVPKVTAYSAQEDTMDYSDSMDYNDSMDYGDSSYYDDDYYGDDHGDEGDDFDPREVRGYTFTWNADSMAWDYDSVGHDKVIFHYPTKGSDENNAVLTIHKFEMTEIIREDSCWMGYDDQTGQDIIELCIDTMEQPTKLKVDLLVGDVKKVDIDLNVNYDSEGEPEMIDASLELTPYKVMVDISRSADGADISFSCAKNGTTMIAVEGDIDMAEDNYGDMVPNSVSGSVQLFGIKVEGSGTDLINTFETLDEDTTMAIDDAIDLVHSKIDVFIYTYPGNVKIAEVIMLKQDSVNEWGDTIVEPAVLMNDGTTKDLEHFARPIIETIEDFFCENFGGEDC